MYRTEELSIFGQNELPVPNTYFCQDKDSDHLAIILPGVGYTCDMPLLYYSTKLLLASGADVLQVRYDYRQTWHNVDLPVEEKIYRLYNDGSAAAKAGLEQRDYSKFTVIGKSLGTLAIPHLFNSDISLQPQSNVYLTPVLSDENLKNQIINSNARNLILIGSADHYFDPAFLSKVVDAGHGDVLIIEGGSHSLELPEDIAGSIQALEKVIQKIQTFLSQDT